MPYVKLTATTTVVLGDGADGNVASFLVWFVDEGSANFSMVTKGRPAKALGGDTGVTAISATHNANIAYKPVATGVLTDPGTTPLVVTTGPAGILIPADGMIVSIVCTRTGGSMSVYWTPMNG
jgi:hypothetical protein